MLVSLTIENWMSFRDRTTLNMVATREQQHKERVAEVKKPKVTVLPVALIFGGNASGKTNFFRALKFVKNMVVDGVKLKSPIPVVPFRLDPEKCGQPTYLCIEILTRQGSFEYSFSMTMKEVIEEKLVDTSIGRDKIIFSRKNGKTKFHKSLDDQKRLDFVSKGTRPNQLFINNAISQGLDEFRSVYDWFEKHLILIEPNSIFGMYERFFDKKGVLYKPMNEALAHLDTGIVHLGAEEVQFDSLPDPQEWKDKLNECDDCNGFCVRAQIINGTRYILIRKGSEYYAERLIACHRDNGGNEVSFDLSNEADGSKRVIDLLPAFFALTYKQSDILFVIDELDRSLHTKLTQKLLAYFLKNYTHQSRSQLLFTAHDVQLIDQALFRRDELWVVERDHLGASSLGSFSEFKSIRFDTDIRKSYLQGRLGGIPNLTLFGEPSIDQLLSSNGE